MYYDDKGYWMTIDLQNRIRSEFPEHVIINEEFGEDWSKSGAYPFVVWIVKSTDSEYLDSDEYYQSGDDENVNIEIAYGKTVDYIHRFNVDGCGQRLTEKQVIEFIRQKVEELA